MGKKLSRIFFLRLFHIEPAVFRNGHIVLVDIGVLRLQADQIILADTRLFGGIVGDGIAAAACGTDCCAAFSHRLYNPALQPFHFAFNFLGLRIRQLFLRLQFGEPNDAACQRQAQLNGWGLLDRPCRPDALHFAAPDRRLPYRAAVSFSARSRSRISPPERLILPRMLRHARYDG